MTVESITSPLERVVFQYETIGGGRVRVVMVGEIDEMVIETLEEIIAQKRRELAKLKSRREQSGSIEYASWERTR
jgi:hypothetical protein